MRRMTGYIPEVGDLVRIREWDDMAAEFDFDDDENIDCNATFIKEMKSLCGVQFVVANIDSNGIIQGCNTVYTISVDMVEPVLTIDEDMEVESSPEIDNYLNQFAIKA